MQEQLPVDGVVDRDRFPHAAMSMSLDRSEGEMTLSFGADLNTVGSGGEI